MANDDGRDGATRAARGIGAALVIIGGLVAAVAGCAALYLFSSSPYTGGSAGYTGLQAATAAYHVATAGNATPASAPFLWWWGVAAAALVAIALGFAMVIIGGTLLVGRHKLETAARGLLAAGITLAGLVGLLIALPYPLLTTGHSDILLYPAERPPMMQFIQSLPTGILLTGVALIVVVIGGILTQFGVWREWRSHEQWLGA